MHSLLKNDHYAANHSTRSCARYLETCSQDLNILSNSRNEAIEETSLDGVYNPGWQASGGVPAYGKFFAPNLVSILFMDLAKKRQVSQRMLHC